MLFRQRKSFWDDFKQFFSRGLGIVLPSVLTLALLWWAYGFLQTRVAEPINGAVRQGIIVTAPELFKAESLPEWFAVTDAQVAARQRTRAEQGQPELADEQVRRRIRSENFSIWWHDRWYMQAIGFVVALILVYLAGLLVGNLIGRRLIQRFERLFTTVPVIKQVYPSVKQVVEFLIGGEEKVLPSSRVVLVQYPRHGIWSIGLMTGETMKSIEAVAGEECVTIFIPSSPTPFTGYTITVPKKDVLELNISLDDALRFCVSGGVLVPPQEVIGRSGEQQLEVPKIEAPEAQDEHPNQGAA